MFYRRKVILALLQVFEGQLDKIRLQKLLFLIANKQLKPEYDFIPYKFGCYSYSANADMTAMVSRGFLNETDKQFEKIDAIDYLKLLKSEDKRILIEVKTLYGNMSSNALMKHTYLNFPFYATRSEVVESILTESEILRVHKAKAVNTQTILFTIGYEGISLEEYLVRLLKNDVKVLIDVRNNPLSMKYGFSKNQLKKYCSSIGIEYIHLPEVGIQSNQRQELNSQQDYDLLFESYRKNNLPKTLSTQQQILELLIQNQRIALTCFESNICQCHRKHLAEAIQHLPNFNYEVKHI